MKQIIAIALLLLLSSLGYAQRNNNNAQGQQTTQSKSKQNNSANIALQRQLEEQEQLRLEQQEQERLVQKEKEKEQYDSQRINRLWKDLNPKYEIFKKQYVINKICPFCNSDLTSKNVNISSDECFFCHTKISDISDGNEKITDLKHEISNLISERTKYEKLIIENEKKLRKLDSEYRNLKIQLFDKNNILRSLESNENDNDDFSYQIMMNRINQLNKEKEEHQGKSEELLKNASEIRP